MDHVDGERAPEGTEEGDRLDVLLALVELYEAKRWPIHILVSARDSGASQSTSVVRI